MGDSLTTRLVMALRSASASVIAAGTTTRAGLAAASDYVETYSGLPCPPGRLHEDVDDPQLPVRLVGDLMLVAEDLRPDAARHLLNALADVAITADLSDGTDPNRRGAVVAECAAHLGLRSGGKGL